MPPRFCLALLLAAAVASAATAATAPSTDAARPLRLQIAVNDVYGKATACECVHPVAAREYPDFLARLQRDHGIELEFVYFSEPYELLKAIQAGRFDGALCKPWLLIGAPGAEAGAFERVADLVSPTGEATLWGDVVVLGDSPIRTLRDLAGRRVALGEADAYEKHHAALALFQRERVAVPAALRSERASCLECLDLLLKREVDAAIISNYALTADCPADILKPDDIRVVARTAKIPLTSLMLRVNRLNPAERLRVGRAVIALSVASLPSSMHGGGFIAPAPWTPERVTLATPER